MIDNIEISGLDYIGGFISEDEEEQLLDIINSKEWSNTLSRRTQHYGYSYDYKRKCVDKIDDIPEEFNDIVSKISKYVLDGESFNQLIINEYVPGQGISPHIDLPQLGDTVVSLSLGSNSTMVFSKDTDKFEVPLNRRSIVVLKDDARYNWKHSIPSRKSDIIIHDDGTKSRVKRDTRISMTFRNVKFN